MPEQTFEIPSLLSDALTDTFGASAVPRWALEAMVAEAVRERLLTVGYAAEVLGVGYFEALTFLNERGVPVDLSDEEMAQDREDLRQMFAL